jgi:hypothetical protein
MSLELTTVSSDGRVDDADFRGDNGSHFMIDKKEKTRRSR